MKRLFTQFSFPGGIPSHVAPETPGSIHEGGELGYALSHAYGAAFDNPDLIVACVVGDGEAETGPLATSWHSNKFLNPATDGAVLPILHLNGYKIANPTVLARIRHDELDHLFRGYGYTPYFVEGDDPDDDAPADGAHARHRRRRDPRASRRDARNGGGRKRPLWPMIVLRTPKGWTGPEGGRRQEDRGLLALAPGAAGRHAREPGAREAPRGVDEELSARGALRRRRPPRARARRAGARRATRRMSANPHANGGLLLQDLKLPDFRDYAVEVPQPGRDGRRGDARDGQVPARRHEAEPRQQELPPLQPRREQLQPLAGRARGDQPRLGRRDPARRRSPRAGRPRDGDAVASTSARAGSRAICSPAGTASSPATRRSSTSSTRCSTSTPSG